MRAYGLKSAKLAVSDDHTGLAGVTGEVIPETA
jgi:transposase-like protein